MHSRTNSAAGLSWVRAAGLTSSHSDSEKRMPRALRTSPALSAALSPAAASLRSFSLVPRLLYSVLLRPRGRPEYGRRKSASSRFETLAVPVASPRDLAAMAARSAAVWRRIGNGARSGSPERWRRIAQASRQVRRASHPRTCRAIAGRGDYQRALIWNPTVCSGAAVSLSRRVAFTPKERSGVLAFAAGESRQPSV